MHIKRFDDAEPYTAPNHFACHGLRLQGFEEGGPTNQWVGLSQFLPAGGAGPDSLLVVYGDTTTTGATPSARCLSSFPTRRRPES